MKLQKIKIIGIGKHVTGEKNDWKYDFIPVHFLCSLDEVAGTAAMVYNMPWEEYCKHIYNHDDAIFKDGYDVDAVVSIYRGRCNGLLLL